MKGNKNNIIIIVLSLAILVIYILFIDNPLRMLSVFKGAKDSWLLCAVGCMVIYWIFESMILYRLCNSLNNKLGFKESFRISMIGQLFNCITPFSSGGQPMQAYCLVKSGIPLGEATCALLAKFIVYQVTLTVYSLVVIFFRFQFFTENVSGFAYLALLGFIINLAVVVALISVGFLQKTTNKVLLKLINLLYKIKIIKNVEKAVNKVNLELSNFYNDFEAIKKKLSILFIPLVITVFQLTAFFAIPYFLCLSLGVMNINFMTMICAGAFVLMISSFVPLPGGSGGAEGGFYLFFGMFFTQSGIIGIVIILWRLITFYLPILAGMIFSGKKYDK